MSKLSEMLSYVAKHSKQRKTTKVIKLQWIASIWCQKHQTNAKLQKWSYFDEFQSIWRQNYQNIWVRSQNYKSNQITMDCIDLTSKRSKLLSYVPKLQSNRITINCIDLMPKRSRMLSYVAKHSKQRKTTKVIKLQWIASIWRQNDHNNAKLQKWSNYNALIEFQNDRFEVRREHSKQRKTLIKNVELRRKTFKKRKTTKLIKLQWICIDLTSKRSKQRKTTKVIKLQWIASIWRQNDQNFWVTSLNYKVIELQLIASIWCQNDQECWVTSQNIQNNAKLRKSSNYNELHRFDVKTITTTQNYESDQIIMHCIDLTSKRSRMLRYVAKHSKQRKSTKLIKLQWIASIWCQNNQKTQNYKSNQITMNLYRFDAKTIKNFELRRKTFKTTQNYENDQIIMNCIDLTSKRSQQRKTTKVIKL